MYTIFILLCADDSDEDMLLLRQIKLTLAI